MIIQILSNKLKMFLSKRLFETKDNKKMKDNCIAKILVSNYL